MGYGLINNTYAILNNQYAWIGGAVGIKDSSTWIPIMTSRTSPSPFVISADSNWDSTNDSTGDRYGSWRTRDNNFVNWLNGSWSSYNNALPHWIKIDLGVNNAICIWKYFLSSNANASCMPKTWKLQGSNNNSAWTDLDSQVDAAAWSANPETRYFELNPIPTTSYRYYRYYATAVQSGSNQAGLTEWNIYKYTP
jgi:hypothetical protein